jgi:hypothetical protein
MIKTYMTKPRCVKAAQFDGERPHDCVRLADGIKYSIQNDCLTIRRRNGFTIILAKGNYLVKVDGEFYVYDAELFEREFCEVTEDSNGFGITD